MIRSKKNTLPEVLNNIKQGRVDPTNDTTMASLSIRVPSSIFLSPTPLHAAVLSRDTKAATLLLDLGANINITDKNGMTPLHHGVSNYEMTKLLLERGAKPNVRDMDGNTPLLKLAHQECHPKRSNGVARMLKQIKLLLSYGARVREKNSRGETVLHRILNCSEVVKVLIDHGAHVNAKTIEGDTPADQVLKNARWVPESMETLLLLLKKGATVDVNRVNVKEFTETTLDLSRVPLRHLTEKIVRFVITKTKVRGALEPLTTLVGGLLKHQDPKYLTFIMKLFRDAGAFSVQKGKGPKGESVMDDLFLDTTFYMEYGKHLCHAIETKKLRLTDAVHPFHVLVVVVSRCRTYNKFNSSKTLTKIVDYLKSKGFDINERLEVHRYSAWGQGITAIQSIESKINIHRFSRNNVTKNPHLKRMRDLHSIMVSRGAITTTGRKSQRDPPPRQRMRNHVTQWTTRTYRNVQNARRQGITPNNNAKRVNRYVSQAFRNSGVRAPVIPREFTVQPNKNLVQTNKRPKYLYRGVHGHQAEKYVKDGKFRDRGYIAFSRRQGVASSFASGGRPSIVMRLNLDSVPRGTPWIWFKTSSIKKGLRNAHVSNIDEGEVLLPPGTLRMRPRAIPLNQMIESAYTYEYWGQTSPVIVDVDYIPDTTAMSLGTTKARKKLMYRPQGTGRTKALREAEENAATTWFSTLFNTTNTTTKKRPARSNGSPGGTKRQKRV